MGHLSSMFNGLSRSLSSIKKTKSFKGSCINVDVEEAVKSTAKDAKRNDLILRTSGIMNIEGSTNLACVHSKRGEKGLNQDCCIVWEEFGCQEDMLFCGIFDGHGPWGHYVANYVRDSMPSSLASHWQETLIGASIDPNLDSGSQKKLHGFSIWKHSYLKACSGVDKELDNHKKIDAFNSGSTALTLVRQGDSIIIANVGDSRAVVGTRCENGGISAVQITTDMKPNVPEEAERIAECKGRVYSLPDEPGAERVWLPHDESPGLAMSRAFGDYCVKDFGLISVPEVSQRRITGQDEFIVLATDGVWDVVSNEEAVGIVWRSGEREKSAKRLVGRAADAWRKKRKGIAMDDISAVVLFFHPSTHQILPVTTQLIFQSNLVIYHPKLAIIDKF